MLPAILPDMTALVTFHFYGKTDHMINGPNLFTRDAWEANAEVWDSRMGDEGNDFFNVLCWPAMAALLDASTSPQTLSKKPNPAPPITNP